MVHASTLRLEDNLYRRARMASKASGQTLTAFTREAISAAVDRAAKNNALLGLVFEYLKDEPRRAGPWDD